MTDMNEPEMNLLRAVLEVALSDAIASNPEVCNSCHDTVTCEACRSGRKVTQCPKTVTYGQCAKAWLQSDKCAEVCEVLGIEHGYLLRQLKGTGTL